MADIELYNKTDLKFTDISSEEYRIYTFLSTNGNLSQIKITDPQWLNVSETGGHGIVNSVDECVYIPTGWISIHWIPKEGRPHFVK